MPLRLDTAKPKKWEKLPSGFLRADAYLTRVGVFEYETQDGTKIQELRSEEEVFHPDSLASFSMLPVVVEHPPEKLLTSKNVGKHARGHLGENLTRDGDKLSGRIMVTDGEAVTDVLSGKRAEISLGYTCDLVEGAGQWNGQPYTHKQIKIRGNHVALTEAGRMGSDIRIRLDSADAIATSLSAITTPPEGQHRSTEEMEKVLINGITFEIPTQAAQALRVERETATTKTDSLAADKALAEKAKAEAEGKAAAADKLAKEADALRLDAIDPKKLDEAVDRRLELFGRARAVLGDEADFKGKDEKSIKLEVLKKLDPDKDFSKQAPEYVAAYFDAMTTSRVEARADSVVVSASDATRAAARDATGNKSKAAEAYEKSQTRNVDAWKKPIGISKQ